MMADIFGTGVRIAKKLIAYLKSEGCIIIHKCTNIRHAKVRQFSTKSLSFKLKTLRYSRRRSSASILSVLMVLNVSIEHCTLGDRLT